MSKKSSIKKISETTELFSDDDSTEDKKSTNIKKSTKTIPGKVPIKAVKVTKSSDKTAQLESFVTSLGITFKAELYLCNSNAYINIDIILPILSVELSWFLKNAESPIHYIKLSKGIYINKYGMTKIIGQSKEAVSFRLQDYLYDIFYQVETTGIAQKSKIISRDELIKVAKLSTQVSHLSNELKMCQNTELINKQLITDITSSYEAFKNDYSVLEMEHKNLKKKYSDLEDEHNKLQYEYNNIKSIASTLAKYVRTKRSDIQEAYDDILDADDDTDTDITTTHKNALAAKKELKKPMVNIPKIKKQEIHKKTYSLLRSPEPQQCISNSNYNTESNSIFNIESGSEFYRWEISDKDQSDEFKTASQDYMIDGEYIIPDEYGGITVLKPPPMIWYCDLSVSDEKIKAINLFLQLSDFSSTEQTMSKLLDNTN